MALSGAGPSVLLVVEGEASLPASCAAIHAAVADMKQPELKLCRFQIQGAN